LIVTDKQGDTDDGIQVTTLQKQEARLAFMSKKP